jgi:hypothetical protein
MSDDYEMKYFLIIVKFVDRQRILCKKLKIIDDNLQYIEEMSNKKWYERKLIQSDLHALDIMIKAYDEYKKMTTDNVYIDYVQVLEIKEEDVHKTLEEIKSFSNEGLVI